MTQAITANEARRAFVFVPQLLQPLIVDSVACAGLSAMLVELVYYR